MQIELENELTHLQDDVVTFSVEEDCWMSCSADYENHMPSGSVYTEDMVVAYLQEHGRCNIACEGNTFLLLYRENSLESIVDAMQRKLECVVGQEFTDSSAFIMINVDSWELYLFNSIENFTGLFE